jgi:hypothetical protein
MSTRDGVHETHCCVRHGCKYHGVGQCPVESGKIIQKHPCEWCDQDKEYLMATIEEVREQLKQFKADNPHVDWEHNEPYAITDANTGEVERMSYMSKKRIAELALGDSGE